MATAETDEDIDPVYVRHLSKETLLNALDSFLRDEGNALDEPIYWHLVDVLVRIQHFYMHRPDVVYESIEFTASQDLLLIFTIGAR